MCMISHTTGLGDSAGFTCVQALHKLDDRLAGLPPWGIADRSAVATDGPEQRTVAAFEVVGMETRPEAGAGGVRVWQAGLKG
jgi:hypothetical protein